MNKFTAHLYKVYVNSRGNLIALMIQVISDKSSRAEANMVLWLTE